MKHATQLTIIGALVLAPVFQLGAQEREGNAAPDYRRAISLVHEELEAAASASAPPAGGAEWCIADAARVSAESIRRVAEIAVEASALPACEFGVEYEDGVTVSDGHVVPMRTLARLLLVDARLLEEAGDHDRAVERLVAAHRLAAHLCADGLVMGSFVSMLTLESIDSAVGWFDSEGLLDGDDRASLLASLEPFRGDDPFGARRAIHKEHIAWTAWVRQRLADEALLEQAEAGLLSGEIEPDPMLTAIVKAHSEGRSIEPYLALAEQGYTHLRAHWSGANALERLREIDARLLAGVYGPFGELILPVVAHVKKQELAAIELVRARAASLGGG